MSDNTTPPLELPLLDDSEEIPTPEEAQDPPTTEETPDVVPTQNIQLDYPYTRTPTYEFDDDQLTPLPSDFQREIGEIADKLPKIKLDGSTPERAWLDVVNKGSGFEPDIEMFRPTLEQPNSLWRQGVEYNGKMIAGGYPRYAQTENQTLVGEKAVLRILAHTRLGAQFRTPLWHSGIWVTFKSPSETAQIELYRMIVDDKISLGRQTYGLIFSHVTSYTVERIVNFALQHVIETTLAVKGGEIIQALKSTISCQDITSLLWGFACSMYPNGFLYQRGCVTDPMKCIHVVKELLDLSKLQWVNQNALTPWQRTHMSDLRPGQKTLENIKRYQEELLPIQERTVYINQETSEELSIKLKSPTIDDYVVAGAKWISGIEDLVNRVLSTSPDTQQRNGLITRHGQATFLRQYDHWVNEIGMGTNVVNDRDTMESTLDNINGDDLFRQDFMSRVTDYINDSTIAVVGIPKYHCPECNGLQDTPKNTSQYIIPLDMIQLFFSLLTLRMARIVRR